jgi:hypothetical protein
VDDRASFGEVSQVLFDGKWRKVKPGSFRIRAYDFSETMPAHGGSRDGVAFAHWEDESGTTWACPVATLQGIQMES